MPDLPAEAASAEATERELLDQAEGVLHSLSLRLLGVSPRLKEPYTDAPELSPWTRTIGPLAKRAHDLAMTIRKHLGLPHRWATSGLGTPPLEIGDVIAAAVSAERQAWQNALAKHYLMNVICNEATKEDNPVCGCSLVFLGWHNSIGEARQAWIDHVLAVVTGEQP